MVQVVLEGFLQVNVPPWMRRLVTRLVSIIPAAVVAGVAGNRGAGKLLVLSQVTPPRACNAVKLVEPELHASSRPSLPVASSKDWLWSGLPLCALQNL